MVRWTFRQYKLIRGLLSFNLGEDTERINPSIPVRSLSCETETNEEWKLFSIKLDMQNVALHLIKSHSTNSPLTCINFIKSHLTVETFSNMCQDIDLVSQEILIMDTRFHGVSPVENGNVFTSILQSIKYSKDDELIQAEVHSRRRLDHYKVTVLLNNMRLMAIFDWWVSVKEYIFTEIENVASSPEHQVMIPKKQENITVDLTLNITSSEIVLVENCSQWDTNAVILKSTTVLKHRPHNLEKPLSCSLNNLEMFSCILGLEDETALSIIDPITLGIDINKDDVLDVQLQFLTVRLSYHDICMFKKMLESLPKQLVFIKDESPDHSSLMNGQISTLTGLGFKKEDCIKALEICENRLDDAALWLTHNAIAASARTVKSTPSVKVNAVEVKANRISICIIDDCGDSDVPLLELSFSDLQLYQLLPELNINDPVYPQGSLQCSLASDYYNRVLSGWEPVLEPWRCKIGWEKAVSQGSLSNRLTMKVDSEDIFNINITSTLIELYSQVKENWTKDYYTSSDTQTGNPNKQGMSSTIDSFRRRSPFIPFALKNDTGSPLKFTTHISDLNNSKSPVVNRSDENWIITQCHFLFRGRDKMRHQDSHKTRLHQLVVKVEDYQCVEPVTVDKVGVYFRDAPLEGQLPSPALPPVRIVFDVALEGSARKLVTIRSALLIVNSLPLAVEINLKNKLPNDDLARWVPTTSFIVNPKATLAVPLVHTHSQINIKPHNGPHQYTYCMPTINWNQMPNNYDRGIISVVPVFEQPAHRIVLLPTVKLENLLPLDIGYNLSGEQGVIRGGSCAAITAVDPEKVVELAITLDNFKTCNTVVVPSGCNTEFSARIKFEDRKQRKLHLLADISLNRITISAYYWIINRTGLPLVFRQSGSSVESAGQFEEHEQARMVAPLLFSFSDQDASHTINARVGKKCCLEWHATVVFELSRPEKYPISKITCHDERRHIRLVLEQYQIHMPFHWSRLDKEQLLCVSILDIPDCCWSGGLKIDNNDSMHINVRDANGRVYFLRLEVLLQGATFFIVFTDADTMPPPIRVDNFSEVSIAFGQSCYIDVMHSTARAHSSVPYAWDEPTKSYVMRLIAPGGVSNTYNMSNLGSANVKDPLDVECQELVLDVLKNNRVILAHKIPGERSQLWRMTSEGHIQHEGSSPPSHPNQPRRQENIVVLDIENTAPQPNTYSRLILRRVDPRRQSTQRWRFTEEGRLCCNHYNMCVQPQDGFYGLRAGTAAVLGMPQPICHKLTDKGIPIEQAIERQRLRPGLDFCLSTFTWMVRPKSSA
ncbi:hypothetical protein NQ317_002301 [Molorchus minor]|uniref:UBA domain-containing protein n=1 Tax=Molorchus minor TaxID=1323400 RepID=A0ABQ9J7X1_9CUCU|nr:hypothetical protein NQ317_002301 [Molorchus minor]